MSVMGARGISITTQRNTFAYLFPGCYLRTYSEVGHWITSIVGVDIKVTLQGLWGLEFRGFWDIECFQRAKIEGMPIKGTIGFKGF